MTEMPYSIGDVVSGVVTGFPDDGGLWLNVGDVTGWVPPREMSLADNESAQDRYAIGDTVHDLFVFLVSRDNRGLFLSVRRNAPGYVEALNAYRVGDVVSATITDISGRGRLWLDIGGLIGSVAPDELSLVADESAQDHYAIGDTVRDLFVFLVSRDQRGLALSVRRNAPGYVEALNAHHVGDVVSATITDISGRGRLWLDVGGVIGSVAPDELSLAGGETAQDRYAVGDIVHDLFVGKVDRDTRDLALSVRRNAHGYVEALNAHSVGDVVSATITDISGRGRLWLDVGGVIGSVVPDELSLASDESAQDRYAVGDTVHDLFVWDVDHDDRALSLSVRRNAPGYVEALDAHSVGDVVSATVTGFAFGSRGLRLDVGGAVGWVGPQDLSLADGESAQDRYAVGDTVHDLFVWHVDRDARELFLSALRNAPGYVEAFDAHSVGAVVSATVTVLTSDGGLWLDVGGVIGNVAPDELSLAGGETAQDRYAVGEPVHDLFVWQINRSTRDFYLSVRRNVPSYVDALNAHKVGDVVPATVTGFSSNGGLWLDVGGVAGAMQPLELALGEGESARDRYAVGDTVHDLFVWHVDREARDLALSARRNAPGYVKALADISVGDPLDGIIAEANEWGVVLDVASVIGWVPASELQLNDGESPPERYALGDTITAQVWQIDQEVRDVLLSVHRHGPDLSEEQISLGTTIIDAVVRGSTPRGIRSPIRVLAANTEVWIPPYALSLSTMMPSRFHDGQVIRVVVTKLDERGRPAELSHRRTLDRWELEIQRLSDGVVVPGARLLASGAISETEGRAAVDLGPITGFIPEDELDSETAQNLMMHSGNETYPVVVKSVDAERGTAIVSHEEFPVRWRKIAEKLDLEEDAEVDAELRDSNRETAWFDLGEGLLAQMPMRELPDSDPPGKAEVDRIGERFSLRITNVDPGKQTVHVKPRDQWIETLVGEPESETLEFKAVLRGSNKNERREMTHEAMRTITGFLNAAGGHLIIGVHDKTRKIEGLEGDRALDGETIKTKIDHATQILESNLANLEPLNLLDDLGGLVTWETPLVRGRTLLVVTCKRGPDAGVNLKFKGKLEFWVRDGSSTKQLRTQNEIRDHLRTRQQRAATAGDVASDD